MSKSFNYTADMRVPLSQIEVNILQNLCNSGDRTGFYLAYYAMTGNTEALLTTKVSSFSDTPGGIAFVANWLDQDRYRVINPSQGESTTYQGIYYLSEQVAKSSLLALENDLGYSPSDLENGIAQVHVDYDVVQDGIVSQHRLFQSSFDAWQAAGIRGLFPGDFLVANSGWTNGQVERMNRTIKEATVKRYYYDSHDQLKLHLGQFLNAYNSARRLKTLRGLTRCEFIAKI